LTPGATRSRGTVITALGVTQILAWGSSYYLSAVLAGPIAAVAGLASPAIGRLIQDRGGRPVLIGSALLIAGGQAIPCPRAECRRPGMRMAPDGPRHGVYDAAFATLGRLYGVSARQAITV
jgi:hypothetical protein